MPRGGWFKVYDDILDDPKVEDLKDLEYRVFVSALAFCNRSPARLRRQGYLYHSKSFPVAARHIAKKVGHPEEEVRAALDHLCEIGGPSSLLILEDGDGGPVYRVRAWRKRQDGDTGEDATEDEDSQNGDKTVTESGQDVPARPRPRPIHKTRDGGRAGEQPAGAPACGWCAKPKGPEAPEVHRLLQSCHDSYRAKHGRCPTLVPGRDGATMKRLLAAGHDGERIRAVYSHYLGSADPFVAKCGFDIPTFGRLFDGVAIALDAGETHGKTRTDPVAGGRRRLPSPASSFGAGGPVKL